MTSAHSRSSSRRQSISKLSRCPSAQVFPHAGLSHSRLRLKRRAPRRPGRRTTGQHQADSSQSEQLQPGRLSGALAGIRDIRRTPILQTSANSLRIFPKHASSYLLRQLSKIASSLSNNATLYDLDLSDNKLGRPGLISLAKCALRL